MCLSKLKKCKVLQAQLTLSIATSSSHFHFTEYWNVHGIFQNYIYRRSMKTEANSQMAAFVLGRDDIVPRLASGSDEGEKQMNRDILGLN